MIRLVHRFIFFIRQYGDVIMPALFVLIVAAFFYRSILFGKLPVPTDALVGLYHPYRDQLASQYPNGIPFKNFLITDPVRQQIPWRKSAVTAIREGRLPLWNAFSFSGTSLVANIQSGAFYPLNVLFIFLPFEVAWTGIIISQPLLAGLFLYWWLRRKNLDQVSSMFGAVSFAFSGFSIAWLTWGTMLSTWLWTPLTMIAIDAIYTHSSKKRIFIWTVISIVSLMSSFFAGHIQIFAYSVALLTAYALWRGRREKKTQLSVIYIVILTGLFAGVAFQLTRIIQWLPETSRLVEGGAWKTEGFFIPIRHLIQFIVPDFFGNPATLNYWGTWNYGEMVGYIGVTGLILALAGVSAQTSFWIWTLGIALLFSLSSPVGTLPYLFHIPVVSSLQPTRLLVVIDYCLSILAAYGFSKLVKGVPKKALATPLLIVSTCFLALWVAVYAPRAFGMTIEQSAVAKRNILFPFMVFCGSASFILSTFYIRGKKARFAMYLALTCIFALSVFDVFRFGWKFTPFTSRTYFFPTTGIISYLQKQQQPFRIMTTDDRILPPNVNEFYGIEAVSGYDPIHSLRYEEYIAAMERGKPDISPPFGFDRIIVPKNTTSPLTSLLNVRYVLSFDQLKNGSFKNVVTEGKTILYEKTDSAPRAYLVERAIYKSKKQDIIGGLYDRNFDFRKEAFVEYPVSVLNFPLAVSESVDIVSYKSDEIIMHVNVRQPRLLVIANMYDPHWTAFIDNRPARFYRTDYLFIGLVTPEGSHTVKLKYN